MLDSSLWLSPLPGPNPSGQGLRNDPRFHELERLMQPQVEVVRDERNNPVSQTLLPVDWPQVLRLAEELGRDGRDLRLLVIVARALANEHGLAGFADGLQLIADTIEGFWDSLHPELREGSAAPALRRTNALLQLENAEDGVLADLRRHVFFAPRGIGPVTGADLERGAIDGRTMLNEAAQGLGEAERSKLVAEHEQMLGRIRAACAAFADQQASDRAALVDAARRALAALGALETAINARMGGGPTFRLAQADRFLARVLSTLDRTPAKAAGAGATAPKANGQDTAADRLRDGDAAAREPGGHSGEAGLPDRISTRDDVVRCLDLIIAFYDRTEPSSPIPHLARRIRRMVPMDFLELMEDLAPSGLKEFRTLAGVPEVKKTAQKDER